MLSAAQVKELLFFTVDGDANANELRTHETASERDSCCTPRYPVVDEDDLYVCAITGEGVECTKLTLVDRMHHYAIDATVDDASVTLHRRSGRLPDDPYDPPPPLDRPLTVLELLAPRED